MHFTKFLLVVLGSLTAALAARALVPAVTTFSGSQTFVMGSADGTPDAPNETDADLANDTPEGLYDEYPKHTVNLATFHLGTYLVRWDEWGDVRSWAVSNGYTLPVGKGRSAAHPVTNLSWYDVVAWCNALSEREGLGLVYFTTSGFTTGTEYRGGTVAQVYAKWIATGYRLPTEAEWEFAARGGVAGKRFPAALPSVSGDTLSHAQANYVATGLSYDASGASSLPWTHPSSTFGAPAAGAGSAPSPGIAYTNPVNEFSPNGLGLYDMAGNIWQWCWDFYDPFYYTATTVTDPRGPETAAAPFYHVLRGGSWDSTAFYARVSNRAMDLPQHKLHGFRVARKGP